MKYGSVCSGIEAATVAWHPLGWQPVWFSEIEPFPCKVLQHHYPTVPNLGDMTKLDQHKIYNNEPIDLLVGGTPCQSFSIAGLRGGLDDERGNIALEFARILLKKQPRWFVWENVPGVFSSFTNEQEMPVWVDKGHGNEQQEVYESSDFASILNGFRECGYSIAYRVLDAQYFGVPQRRRRVFVVGYLGNDWRPPYAVLFEPESLFRNFEKSAKTRKGIAGKVEGNTKHSSYFNKQSIGEYSASMVASTVSRRDHKDATDLVITGYTASQHGNYKKGVGTLRANGGDLGGGSEIIIAFGAQNSSSQGLSESEHTCPTLDKSKVPAICLQGSINETDKHDVVYSVQTGQTGANGSNISENISPTVTKNDKHAVVYDTTQITSKTNRSNPKEEVCHTLAKGSDAPLLAKAQIARRLTPLECERLQGFPDNYTNIPGAKDSPRYSAIGNSMAVPVMKWIGTRIDLMEKILNRLQLNG